MGTSVCRGCGPKRQKKKKKKEKKNPKKLYNLNPQKESILLNGGNFKNFKIVFLSLL